MSRDNLHLRGVGEKKKHLRFNVCLFIHISLYSYIYTHTRLNR